MCGIFGLVKGSGQLLPNEVLKYTEQALRVGSLRGSDSVGLMLGTLGKPVDWLKRTGTGESLAECPEFLKRTKGLLAADYVVGHHRSATLGSVTVDNAHPFSEGGITMVHNGTLRGDYAVTKTKARGVEVDSHVLCHELADARPDEAELVLEKVTGAYCVVWYDVRDGSLNMARNSERPLHLFRTKDNKNLLFSSEHGMTSWLIERISITAAYVAPLPVLEVHKYLPGGDVSKPEVTPINGKGWEQYMYGYNQYKYRAPARSVPSAASTSSPPAVVVTPTTPPVTSAPQPTPTTQSMRAVMWNHGVTEDFRVPFTPLTLMGTGLMMHSTKTFSKCAVVGTIDTLQMPAIIHDVNYAGAKSMFDGRWLVRPTGVFFDPTGKAMLICKLVKRPGQWRDSEIVKNDAVMDMSMVYPDVTGAMLH